MVKPNSDKTRKDILKLLQPAINPIMGGPNNKPKKPIVDTAAIANAGLACWVFPAALNTKGIMGDTPTPTSNIPKVAGINIG